MSTSIVILAQGQQRRLPELSIPKQLLALPACAAAPDDPTTILARTLVQIAMLSPVVESEGIAYCDGVSVTVVCGDPLYEEIEIWGKSSVWNTCRRVLHVLAVSLKDPGNSSLKGIARFLIDQGFRDADEPEGLPLRADETVVVLLGDVVYSWETLHECMTQTYWGMKFVGSPDLSPSGGELWGLMWTERARASMMTCLDRALAKHPPFAEYQPGQMRRWLWAIDDQIEGEHRGIAHVRDSVRQRTWFKASDPSDYTRDIDLPEHVRELGALSEKAAADDARHGLVWGRR